jgi:hypothetical protein
MVARDIHFWLTGWENTVVAKTFVKQRLICTNYGNSGGTRNFVRNCELKSILCLFPQICLVNSFPLTEQIEPVSFLLGAFIFLANCFENAQ